VQRCREVNLVSSVVKAPNRRNAQSNESARGDEAGYALIEDVNNIIADIPRIPGGLGPEIDMRQHPIGPGPFDRGVPVACICSYNRIDIDKGAFPWYG
jgi:hypothetical protein